MSRSVAALGKAPVPKQKGRKHTCEALVSKDRKSWSLLQTKGDKLGLHVCGQPAKLRYANEYLECGGAKYIWLCAECDTLSATQT
jgi:hypothetical protein